MLEGSRVTMPRLADCSSGRAAKDCCESDLAALVCALAPAGKANVPKNITARSRRGLRGELCLRFIRVQFGMNSIGIQGSSTGHDSSSGSKVSCVCEL